MNNVIIQPVGKDNYFRCTVVDGIEKNSTTYQIEKKFSQYYDQNGRLRIYGVVNRHKEKWNKIQRGDIILFTGENKVLYRAYIAAKVEDKEISKELYDNPEYSYLYAIQQLTKLDIPYEEFNEIVGYVHHYIPRSFSILAESKAKSIIDYLDLTGEIIENITTKKQFAIDKLMLKNFRCFDDIDIDFHDKLNVIIGINGAGKSTILDATAVALGCFVGGFDNMPSVLIKKDDIKLATRTINDRIESVAKFPVEVAAEACFGNEFLSWKKILNSESGTNSDINTKSISRIAEKYQKIHRNSEEKVVFPILAYYKTNRFFIKNLNVNDKEINLNQLNGYRDWAEISTSEKRFYSWFEKMTYIEIQRNQKQRELFAVKEAMKTMYKLMYKRNSKVDFIYDIANSRLELLVEDQKEYLRIPISMLSDGTRGILTLTADIAFRMALLNPELENILETPGVVLIDEIDMHLHPEWQKNIISNIQRIFPNIQLICTTHSPNILANVKDESIIMIENYQALEINVKTYGRSVASILNDVMKTQDRASDVENLLNTYRKLLDEGSYESAKQKLDALKTILGENDLDYIKANTDYEIEAEDWFENLPDE